MLKYRFKSTIGAFEEVTTWEDKMIGQVSMLETKVIEVVNRSREINGESVGKGVSRLPSMSYRKIWERDYEKVGFRVGMAREQGCVTICS